MSWITVWTISKLNQTNRKPYFLNIYISQMTIFHLRFGKKTNFLQFNLKKVIFLLTC